MKFVSVSHEGASHDRRLEIQVRNEGLEGATKLEIVLLEPVRDAITFAEWPIAPGASWSRTFLLREAEIAAVRVYSGSATESGEFVRTDCRVLAGDASYCE